MGWRFRKSITLFPGVKVNLGLKSASLSLGGKGFRTTYSTTGRVTKTFGIPGTGFSYVTSTNRKNNSSSVYTQSGRYNEMGLMASNLISEDFNEESTLNNVNLESDHSENIKNLIVSIYEEADMIVNWRQVLIDEYNEEIPNWDYLKARADKVLNGDLDTYFEIITDLNPVDDLLCYGSEFECATEDPRMLYVHFHVNSSQVLKEIAHLPKTEYNELLQDYVCGCAIRVARDLFAILPFRRIIIDAENQGKDILSVEFLRDKMMNVDYTQIDASEFVLSFNNRMDFTPEGGFKRIKSLD